jgi:hypothetical protein
MQQRRVFFIFNNLHQVRSKPKDRKIVLQSIEPFENKLVNNVTCMVLYKINVAFVLIGSTRRPTHRILLDYVSEKFEETRGVLPSLEEQ